MVGKTPPPGGIIPARRPDPRPTVLTEFKLPFALRGTEPIFQYLISTANRTLQQAERQVEIEKQELGVLREIRDAVKGEISKVNALGDPPRD